MSLKETYNRIAAEWSRDHSGDDWWISGTEIFATAVGAGGLVLDVGCASGIKSRYLQKRGLRVIGIDFSEEFIKIAKQEPAGVDFRVMDMYDADLLPEEFDGIFAQASLLHIPASDIPRVLAGLVSRLKKGGFLYVAVKERHEDGPPDEVKKEFDYREPYERFFSYFTREEMESFIEGAGLSLASSSATPSGKTTWIQIIGRKL